MMFTFWLEVAANGAAILTAVIAVTAYSRFIHSQKKRQRALENYLKEQKIMTRGEGRRSVIHLMANLAMTEAEVLDAAFRSKQVATIPGIDNEGKAHRLLFEYCGTDLPERHHF